MDYKDTLNLPQTAFPMKASLSTKEPERIKKWDGMNVYQKMLDARDRNNPYILHDDLHMLTARSTSVTL